jgi:hypothetical protein
VGKEASGTRSEEALDKSREVVRMLLCWERTSNAEKSGEKALDSRTGCGINNIRPGRGKQDLNS